MQRHRRHHHHHHHHELWEELSSLRHLESACARQPFFRSRCAPPAAALAVTAATSASGLCKEWQPPDLDGSDANVYVG